jgi:hypothetical protein
MSAIKHPTEKKRLELARDHRVFAESKRGFRRGWKLKKRDANKSVRRAARSKLPAIPPNPLDAEEPLAASRKSLKTLKKSGVTTLAVALRLRGARRIERFSRVAYRSSNFSRVS